ncbi:hypothetical protein D1646_19715 [Pseudoflavonifractor sp. 60]|uniref:tripartite tricarboxylate transporter permease n=1 Tax=Pseudoflavonifractor sp. 60 TaxID=2304576 RepID=UPI00136F5EF5|nr:tripartite tricarboxylate transporter permease [Pseudoflavonifractor sp. 60]NBI68967.1 hypothetical protein [Pseudoflavonifractor sp. 60]
MILDVLSGFLHIQTLLFVFAGVAAGILGGSLPGVSPSMTISLLLPITLKLNVVDAMALLMGAYQGAMMGGSISAILINTPGTASAAATMLDGYPMNQKGQTRKALQTALYASCVGGLTGTFMLVAFADGLASLALRFGAPEYFGIMCLSLALIASISGKSLLKGLVSATIGLFIAMIGLDPIYGTARFTFGNTQLNDGVDQLAVFIGSFAIAELMFQLGEGKDALSRKPEQLDYRSQGLKLKEFLGQWFNIIRSGVIGALIGILPGVGGSTASFVAYAAAQKQSKRSEEFGTGIIDGVVAAEASNNGVCGGALVPLLALGIPGDVVTAVMLGAFVALGITPGPLLFQNNLDTVYAVYIAMAFAILALAVVGTLGIPLFSRIMQTRKSILLPAVFLICFVGTYAVRGSYFTCFMMMLFGILAFFLRKGKFPIPPMIIAFVIGGSLESNFRRSLLYDANLGWKNFFTRPLTLAFLVAAVVLALLLAHGNKKQTKEELK